MLEASVLSTSPWNVDPFLWKDAGSVLGFEHLLPDATDSLVQDFDTPDVLRSVPSPEPSASDHVSQTEPDFADMLLDFDAAEEEIGVAAVLALDETTPDPTADSDWSNSAFSTCEEDPWMGTRGPRRRARTPDFLTGHPSKSWLMMNGEEQLRTVETLTEVISRRLDLREQVEVIRIIDPDAVLHPTDREFVIDLKRLDDRKLREIADYVRRHAADWDRLDDRHGNSASSSTASSGGRRRQRNSGSVASSAASETSSSSSGPPFSKHRTQRRRRQQGRTWRQRKARRQLQKERRSGLFLNEQVLSIGDSPGSRENEGQTDEEEVDVLH